MHIMLQYYFVDEKLVEELTAKLQVRQDQPISLVQSYQLEFLVRMFSANPNMKGKFFSHSQLDGFAVFLEYFRTAINAISNQTQDVTHSVVEIWQLLGIIYNCLIFCNFALTKEYMDTKGPIHKKIKLLKL